jgi:hypothetical protein
MTRTAALRRQTVFRRLLETIGAVGPEYAPNFNARTKAKAESRMGQMDAWSPELRALAHEFDFHVVNTFVGAGITKAPTIRNLILTARGINGSENGGMNYGNKRPGKP